MQLTDHTINGVVAHDQATRFTTARKDAPEVLACDTEDVRMAADIGISHGSCFLFNVFCSFHFLACSLLPVTAHTIS